ncbi:MAG: two-component system, sensor histidine kinase YesM [Clostridiales bacterium]|nr:two-component system, sensor histidine kinase YesM [Clostridiales bacterium]
MLALFGGYLFLNYVSYVFAIKPYRRRNKMFQLFSEGFTIKGVFELQYPTSPEEERMLARFQDMLDTRELINVSKKQAEYLALQNQINPHFLYNTLEGIRSEALGAGIEGVAKMSEALSLFFRYTISNVENLVSLEDELKNVENYYIIQQFRFEDRLKIIIDLDAGDEQLLLSAKMPKLMLQPIVENSIYHGLEEKLGQGIVKIHARATLERLIITISDNGLGMSEEEVDKLNKKLRSVELIRFEKEEKERKGGIALTNVNSRIQLLFGEEYGLYVYSTKNEGTQVEITLPYVTG